MSPPALEVDPWTVEASSGTRITSGGQRPGQGASRGTPPGQRPTWAEIDLDAITANVAALKAHARAPRLLAAVKADGYGHGLVQAARAALAGGADWLGVALVEEGAALRAAGVSAPVLLFTEPPVDAIGALLAARLTPTVYSAEFVQALESAAAGPLDVHLKLDTGMRRVGVPQAQWDDALRRLRASPVLRLQGLWSHLAVADQPDHPFTARQTAEFRRGLELASALGLRPALAHLANSAATLLAPDTHFDLVRPGIAVYGLAPAPGVNAGVNLIPALAWYSRVALVKRLAAGEAVSYGLRWPAPRDTTVATVPAGYGDGVSRALSNRGWVQLAGLRAPIAGTVCMDQFLVDAGDSDVTSGDEVVLLGQGVTAQDWADLLDTITYEVVCAIGGRVPRVYLSRDPELAT